MTEADILAQLLILAAGLLPGSYFLYLYALRPWSYLKTQRKLHGWAGDTWMDTEAGGMAIDDEEWRIYLYKVD